VAGGSAEAVLNINFGSLLTAMRTLFGCICGGVEWILVVAALDSINQVWSSLFMFYISFCLFAMLNVMTGVFCQGAIEGAERDQEMLVHTVMSDRSVYLDGLRKLFEVIDDDNDGSVTVKEFEEHFNDDAVRSLFLALQLDPADAWELFVAIDGDGSGTIDAAEFLDACLYLRGPAKAINLAGVKRDVMKMKLQIDEIGNALGVSSPKASNLIDPWN